MKEPVDTGSFSSYIVDILFSFCKFIEHKTVILAAIHLWQSTCKKTGGDYIYEKDG